MTTFLTSTCNRNYKRCIQLESMDYCGDLMKRCFQTKTFILPEPVSLLERNPPELLEFDEEENEVNFRRCRKKKFYDQKICRHLCSRTIYLESSRSSSFSPCDLMCFQLTRSFESAGEVCPFQKYCAKGCPCPSYNCEKVAGSRQKFIPLLDLKKSKTNLVVRCSS